MSDENELIRSNQTIPELHKRLEALENKYDADKQAYNLVLDLIKEQTVLSRKLDALDLNFKNLKRSNNKKIEELESKIDGFDQFKNIAEMIKFHTDETLKVIDKNLEDQIDGPILGAELSLSRERRRIEQETQLRKHEHSEVKKLLKKAVKEEDEYYRKYGFFSYWSADLKAKRIREQIEHQLALKIVKRLIELKQEFYKKYMKIEKSPEKNFIYGKAEGLEKALTVIEGFLDYDPEIHKLIDDSRK